MTDRRVYHALPASSHSKIHALPSDFSDGLLGLAQRDYEELVNNVTHVIHLAWSVNFNKGLESFERDCIAGAKNLIDLCLKVRRPQPATFNFCSSVSATARTPGGVVPEALPESLSFAQGMGYAQSKLVTEHLCDRAAKQTGIQARVLRVGQIIGDTRHGVWNDTEAIPMIFQTAKTVGALPQLDETPAWLPVDTVADAFVEISSSGADAGVMNIVNHNTFHWTRDLLPLLKAAGLQFEEVKQQEWIRRLRQSDPDPVANPPIKLVDFFASKYDNDKPRVSSQHSTELARSHSLALQNAKVLDLKSMSKIMSYLAEVWQVDRTESKAPLALVIGGPCGTGKSTVALTLAEELGFPVIEGDNLHSRAAREQMGRQVALTDSDRLSWLSHIRGAVMDRIHTSKAPAVIVTCSALRSVYRDELRMLQEIAGIRSAFIMLSVDNSVALKERMDKREGHYMTSAMIADQVSTLEAALEHEIDIIPVDAAREQSEVAVEIRAIVEALLA